MQATKAFDRIFFRLTHPAKEVVAASGKNKGKKVIERKQERFDDFQIAEAAWKQAGNGAKLVQIHEVVQLEQVLPRTQTATPREALGPREVGRYQDYSDLPRQDERSFRRAQ